jgi:DNA invertase Pin-like site-specific DNA recombinase
MDTTRAAIYTRISQDQTGKQAGVERQLDESEALAQRLNFTVVERYRDNDISAYSGKRRPGYEAMLDGVKRGDFTAIVCYHPDRLYRSLKDLERLIDITEAANVKICSVNGGDFDLSTATGKMVARILGSVARQEVEHKAERQRSANAQRRSKGQWAAYGRVPWGYTKVGELRDLSLVPKEPEASLIRKAAADVLAGVSIRSIAMDWTKRGVQRANGDTEWSNFDITGLLMNPVYAAQVVKGEGYRKVPRHLRVDGPGNWEPIIDKETWDGLVAFLSDPARKKGTKFIRLNMLSGVVLCGLCGRKMYMNWNNGTRVYVCRTRHLGRNADALDELVDGVVLTLLSQQDIQSRLVVPAGRPGVDVEAMRTRRIALQARMDELARMFAAGSITGSQLNSGTEALRGELLGIDALLAELATSSPALALLEDGDAPLDERWEAASADIRGKIVDELMTVTAHPAPKGTRFNPDYIEITPKI